MKKIILIAGGTASGKTMIAEILHKEYTRRGKTSTLMVMDNYYKDLKDLPEEKGEDVNWDSPDVIDWERFLLDIKKLQNGENVKFKLYEFSLYSHPGAEIEYASNDVIIIEGLFTLFNKEIREMSSAMLFVDVDDDIRLLRRIERDKNGRYKETFNIESFFKKWKNEIKPMHKKFVQPTSEYSDFIIKNNNDFVGKEKIRMINLLHSIVVK